MRTGAQERSKDEVCGAIEDPTLQHPGCYCNLEVTAQGNPDFAHNLELKMLTNLRIYAPYRLVKHGAAILKWLGAPNRASCVLCYVHRKYHIGDSQTFFGCVRRHATYTWNQRKQFSGNWGCNWEGARVSIAGPCVCVYVCVCVCACACIPWILCVYFRIPYVQ